MFRHIDDAYTPAATAASSAEPFRRPDHKSKKHGKPGHKRRFPKRPRNGEEVGGGYFVFRRGDSTHRIRPCEWPYEHPSYDSAIAEASRLASTHGGEFQVYACVGGATAEKLAQNAKGDSA